jgi:hypothetical protein
MSAVQLIAPSVNFPDGLPVLIAGAGDRAALRVLDFFTVKLRNRNTREITSRLSRPVQSVAILTGTCSSKAPRPQSSKHWQPFLSVSKC